MKEFYKKESPVVGYAGFGGGVSYLSGIIGPKTYVDDVFSTFLYVGNEGSQTINNGIDLTGEGGLVWCKRRFINPERHCLFDTENGITKTLSTSESTGTRTRPWVTSFNSNGWSMNTGDTELNNNDEKYASWTFRKAPGFFDVVTWTGNATNRVISHNLGSVPGMIMVKRTDATENWHVYHRSTGATKYLILDSTNAEATGSSIWNDTTPTSTNFTVGTNGAVNGSGGTYVAYVFAHDDQSFGTDSDESIIKCGTYTGTGSAYKEIDLGFEPQLVFFKNSSHSNNWYIMDTMRGLTADGEDDEYIFPNLNNAAASTSFMYPTSNGFGFTATGGGANASGNTYIYMAIRRPNKPPAAAINVFIMDTSEGTSPTPPQFTSGFVSDFIIRKTFNGANNQFGSRLTGTSYMSSYSNSTESGASLLTWDFMDGWSNSVSDPPDTNLGCYMFKRAPGFMDVVSYRGTAVIRTVAHNLEAVPELIIVKKRDTATADWPVYSAAAGSNSKAFLNLNDATTVTSDVYWGSTTPTSSVFTVGAGTLTNGGGANFIAYLFATLPGISKVGTFSGTGSNINVDCGFTSGARFILIKRTDSTGDWYVWDTLRGIGSGNDPYWLVNTTDNPVTNTDYVDSFSSGFTVTSSAPDALNVSGGTYLFMAIA